MRDYEEDHLIPLELGGAPADRRNLWPEPRYPADGWTAERKDQLESTLRRAVCDRTVALVAAQIMIAKDWVAAYGRFVRDGAER